MKFVVMLLMTLAISNKVAAATLCVPSRLCSPSYITVTVHWQMQRSRSSSSLSGTVTENYAAEWKLWPHAGSSALESPFDKVALTWLLDVSDLKSGQLVLTRMELVRLLGIIQELPQDGRLWQSDALLFVQVQGVWTRNQEIMFRYSDENGALVLKLSARSDVRY